MTTLDIRIDSIAAGGDGVGRSDGLVVFVPRTAPGDLARVRAVQQGRLMRGVVEAILEPSPLRAIPACPHYVGDRCGGCQIQHLDYERGQLPSKAAIISDALRRIGKRANAPVPEVVASEKRWRYRAKLTLAIRRRDGGWYAGLRRYDAPDDVFELRDCPITDQRVVHAWAAVMRQQRHFPAAAELRGAVRALESGFAFILEGGREWPAAAQFFAEVPELSQLWWIPEDGKRRLLGSRDAPGESPGAAFTQVNPGMAAHLREWVLSIANSAAPQVAVDAYAGAGEYAIALANAGARVTAIEIDRDASRACGSHLPDGSRAIAEPVERALSRALPADLVIVNPPRAGLHESVPAILNSASARLKVLVYVSCDPATLARDVRRLDAFRIRSLRGFDMFPQTAHVETVCELVRAA